MVILSFNRKIQLLMAGAGVLSILVAFVYLLGFYSTEFMGPEQSPKIPQADFWAFVSLAFGVCLLGLLAFSYSRQTDKKLILASTYGIIFLALIQIAPLLMWSLTSVFYPANLVSTIPHILVVWLSVWLCRLFTNKTT
ncbi:hypothetical protein [Paenibacillus mucilaginosus]|uniref:hypothetical protein n=1 Tax=Paenibacillus mucilaginosus TaxID=61624 RepID=UPI001F40B3C1|nr:hypothetical protein [Paenibacillus mucilaginosus]MCG7214536.1 hypothetical protein [Paenibacillus mucilaginosus]